MDIVSLIEVGNPVPVNVIVNPPFFKEFGGEAFVKVNGISKLVTPLVDAIPILSNYTTGK
jgi:hypothetical protein